jgi:hypothetical protein
VLAEWNLPHDEATAARPEFLAARRGGGLCRVFRNRVLDCAAAARHRADRHISPETYFFGIYGIVALCGAASCIHTYLISGDPPEKPPQGGVPVRELRVIEGGRARSESGDDVKRHAA